MTAVVMCQGPHCTSDATQRIAVEGTALNKQVCYDELCRRWAKGELGQDRPGAVIVTESLGLHSVAWEDDL